MRLFISLRLHWRGRTTVRQFANVFAVAAASFGRICVFVGFSVVSSLANSLVKNGDSCRIGPGSSNEIKVY